MKWWKAYISKLKNTTKSNIVKTICALLLIAILATPSYAEDTDDVFSQFIVKRTSRVHISISPVFSSETFFPTGIKFKVIIYF